MTPQELFQLYHTECLKEKNGAPPRKVSNFEKFNASRDFAYFQKFCQTIERAGDLLNVDLFVRALARQYHGFFPPKAFIAPSAMRIYREFLHDFNKLEDPADIYSQLLADCKFVAQFCADNRMFDGISQYLAMDAQFIPVVIRHCYSGKISFFFLAAHEHFPTVLSSYPPDAVELIRNFDFKLQRSKLIFIDKCRVICDNLDKLIKMLIDKNLA